MGKKILSVSSIILIAMLTGCATTHSTDLENIDPWENWNRKVQSFNDGFDQKAMIPVAESYVWVIPTFIDRAITNFFSNIDDIGVTINNSLQGKFKQSGMDGARFLINSTVGLAGFVDVASLIDLPKHNEDFGQTLGVWGVPSGPYIVLPLYGSSSVRGIAGMIGDAAMNPISYISSPFISGGLYIVSATDFRADNLGTVIIAKEFDVFGGYEFYRDSYIQSRRFQIADGEDLEDDDFFLEEYELLELE